MTFAFKYEGGFSDVLKALFSKIQQEDVGEIITNKPTSQYTRKLWFMYEWLLEKPLAVPDLLRGSFVDLLDESLQYPGPVTLSKRHQVRNNLPGVKNFCPFVMRTEKLDRYIELHLNEVIKKIRKYS